MNAHDVYFTYVYTYTQSGWIEFAYAMIEATRESPTISRATRIVPYFHHIKNVSPLVLAHDPIPLNPFQIDEIPGEVIILFEIFKVFC